MAQAGTGGEGLYRNGWSAKAFGSSRSWTNYNEWRGAPHCITAPWKVSPWWWLLRLTQCCRAITWCSAFLGPAVNWWPFSAIAACSSPSVYRREVGVLSFHFVHYSGYPGFGNGVTQEVWVGTITLYCGPMAKPRCPSEARETNSLHRSSNHLQIICHYNHL